MSGVRQLAKRSCGFGSDAKSHRERSAYRPTAVDLNALVGGRSAPIAKAGKGGDSHGALPHPPFTN
jgi:hypothetical protein